MSGLGPDTGDPVGRRPGSPPHFTTAENVNPPLPGDPGYEDYVARRGALMLWLDQQRMTKPGIELSFTPYYDGGLGRMVTPEDPAPVPGTTAVREPCAGVDARLGHRGRRWADSAVEAHQRRPNGMLALNSTVMSSASTIAAADGSPSIATVGMSMT